MRELGYDPDIRKFRHKVGDFPSIYGKIRRFDYYFIHDYYPINHFGWDVDENIIKIRDLIFNFKDGQNSASIADLFSDAIVDVKIDLTNLLIIVIPASTPEKTEFRYRSFTNRLSSLLGIVNAMDAISTVSHESTKGSAGGNKIQYFTFHNNCYYNKNVLLIDDVRTSGTTYIQVLKKLMETGASKVTGALLGKTVSLN